MWTALLGIGLKLLIQEIFSRIFAFLDKQREAETNQELGGAVTTGNILIENQRQVTEIRNAEERYSDLPRDELLRRLRERGHGG